MLNIYILEYKRHPSFGNSGECCNSVYDLSNACQNCGTGAKLVANLRVKGISKVNKEVFVTMDGDDLISEDLYERMLEKSVKFGNLPQVENTKSLLLPYYYLRPEYFLPKFSDKTTGFVKDDKALCQICNQNCYFAIPHVEFKLHYDELPKKLLEQSDILSSWEHWGYSFKEDGRHSLKYSRPLLIVTENFKNAIEEIGLKYVVFVPIAVGKYV